MNNTSTGLDLSSIVTQVSRDDDNNRSTQLVPTTTGIGRDSQISNRTQNRRTRTERIVSLLLCCLGGSCRRRSPHTSYPPSDNSPSHERERLNFQEDIDYEPHERSLLPAIRDCDRTKICLVIDLDETLVHSVFRPVPNADFVVPVEIDGEVHKIYVSKRPHVDEFLRCVGALFECILFTASLAKYADPVADLLDTNRIFRARLFREACTFYNGNYIKDLNRLGRDIQRVIIIDNSPLSYLFHQDNAVPVASWFDDVNDKELLALIPIFERLATVDNVLPALQDIHQR